MPFKLTNRGRFLLLQYAFRHATTRPAAYYLGLVTKVNELALDAGPATNEGSGLVGIPVTGHGYADGAAIVLEGTTNYDGRYLVDASSTVNKVIIEATYVAETFGGDELIHQAPGPDDHTLGDLTEIVAGNGYTTGGLAINPNTTDFDVLTQDDAADRSYIQIKDTVFTAAAGPIPASGDGARYSVLLDNHVTPASRQVIAVFDLMEDRIVPDGQSLTLIDAEISLNEVSA